MSELCWYLKGGEGPLGARLALEEHRLGFLLRDYQRHHLVAAQKAQPMLHSQLAFPLLDLHERLAKRSHRTVSYMLHGIVMWVCVCV